MTPSSAIGTVIVCGSALRGTLVDDWFFGLRIETSASNRSTNVTFGDDAGPFGKTSDRVQSVRLISATADSATSD